MRVNSMYFLNFNDGFIEVPFASPSLNIYTVGCEHHCKGCHAPDLQNYNHENRKNLNFFDIEKKLNMIKGFYKSVCWLGGDPLYQFEECYTISKKIKEIFPNVVNVVYTGYNWPKFFDENKLNYDIPFDYVIDGTWNGKMLGQEGCNQKIWRQKNWNQNINLGSSFNFKEITFDQYKMGE